MASQTEEMRKVAQAYCELIEEAAETVADDERP